MQDQLFIPAKIKAGFQKRDDTYTKQLAYVIYWDTKGVLRKETSWQGWRDRKIDPIDIDNIPYSGFVLNKSVKRDSSYFGNGRNMIRIYDDRGIEFEITTGNLLFILMTTNCHKRGLEGEFVYAWYGTELVLLPVNCEEYQNSIEFTGLQGKCVKAKELILGAVYENKKQKLYTYLGKYDWHEFVWDKDDNTQRIKKSKRFVFADKDKEIVAFRDIKSFSRCVTDTRVMEYATLMEKFWCMSESSPVVEIVDTGKTRKIKNGDILYSYSYYYSSEGWYKYDPKNNVYKKYGIYNDKKYNHTLGNYDNNYKLKDTAHRLKFDEEGNVVKWYEQKSHRSYEDLHFVKHLTQEEVENYQIPIYHAVLSNGKTIDLNQISNIKL